MKGRRTGRPTVGRGGRPTVGRGSVPRWPYGLSPTWEKIPVGKKDHGCGVHSPGGPPGRSPEWGCDCLTSAEFSWHHSPTILQQMTSADDRTMHPRLGLRPCRPPGECTRQPRSFLGGTPRKLTCKLGVSYFHNLGLEWFVSIIW